MNTDFSAVPQWLSEANSGAGIAVADLSGDGLPDVVVLKVDDLPGQNAASFRIGSGTDDELTVGAWSPWIAVPDWFPWANSGGDVTVADVDGDGRPDLVVLMVDAPDGPNQGYYRSGPLNDDDTVTAWRPWGSVPDGYFWENQGAGIATADLDGDGVPELVVLAVDSPPGRNGGYCTVGWHLDGGRPADGWGPW